MFRQKHADRIIAAWKAMDEADVIGRASPGRRSSSWADPAHKEGRPRCSPRMRGWTHYEETP